LAIVTTVGTVVLCIVILQQRTVINQVAHWGYAGCFFISTLASGTMVLPSMGSVVTFTLGSVLNPALVGLVSGFGEAIGAVWAYLTGYGGRSLVDVGAMQKRLAPFIERHQGKAIFAMAAIINPLYYPFSVWMGVLRVGVYKFAFCTLLGRTVKNLIVAYMGYFGIRSILQWLGVIN